MAITGPIPIPETGMDAFLKQLQIGTQNRQAQEKIAQESLANEQLNQYRQGELGVSQGRLALEKELGPLKLNLLKERIKAAKQEGLPELTKANITRNQTVVQNVDNLLPQIDELTASDFPDQLTGKYFNPSSQADYDSRIAKLSDSLISALNLPKTDQSLHLVDQIVRQKPLEGKESYLKRMKNLKSDLMSRKSKAQKALVSRNVEFGNNSTESNQGAESPDGADKKIIIRNKKTGEIKAISKKEAEEMGVYSGGV